jgi:SPP1 gp7 family putative phage head morphogenesis protein
MTGLPPPIDPELRARLRRELKQRASEFLTRFNRHDVLMARGVRGVQIEAVQQFRRLVVEPLLDSIGGTLAGIDARGREVTPERYPQLALLLDEIDLILQRGILELRQLTEARLQEVGQREADFVAENVERTTDQAIPLVQAPDPSQQRVMGDTPEQWFDKMLQAPTGDSLRRRILQGLEQGETVDQIVRGIRGSRTEEGILDKAATGVETLVRTAATTESNAAREETFRELGIERWRFVATLDSRTTILCASLDGKTYPVGEGPMPPLHPNCRSTAVPFFDEEPEGTRAAFDGQVEASVTFEEWLQTRPQAEQNEMLGKTKAAAWRRGDITLQQMLGRDLQPLTLEELRQKDRL